MQRRRESLEADRVGDSARVRRVVLQPHQPADPFPRHAAELTTPDGGHDPDAAGLSSSGCTSEPSAGENTETTTSATASERLAGRTRPLTTDTARPLRRAPPPLGVPSQLRQAISAAQCSSTARARPSTGSTRRPGVAPSATARARPRGHPCSHAATCGRPARSRKPCWAQPNAPMAPAKSPMPGTLSTATHTKTRTRSCATT